MYHSIAVVPRQKMAYQSLLEQYNYTITGEEKYVKMETRISGGNRNRFVGTKAISEAT